MTYYEDYWGKDESFRKTVDRLWRQDRNKLVDAIKIMGSYKSAIPASGQIMTDRDLADAHSHLLDQKGYPTKLPTPELVIETLEEGAQNGTVNVTYDPSTGQKLYQVPPF